MPENSQVVREAYDAFSRGDIPALLALLSEGIEWEGTAALPQGGSFRGRAGVGEFFAGVARHWPELEIEIDDLIADGDKVVGVGRGEGRLTNGAQAEYGFTHVFTLANGEIVRFREYASPGTGLL